MSEIPDIKLELTAKELFEAVTNAGCDSLQLSKIFSSIMKERGQALTYEKELDAALEQRFGLKP